MHDDDDERQRREDLDAGIHCVDLRNIVMMTGEEGGPLRMIMMKVMGSQVPSADRSAVRPVQGLSGSTGRAHVVRRKEETMQDGIG
jgi:hypothetical protein